MLAPANADDGGPAPIPDSVDITIFMANSYSSLIPKEHEKEVKRLIYALHDINFFSLTFAGKPEMQQRNVASLEARMKEDVSERYRKAIEYKLRR